MQTLDTTAVAAEQQNATDTHGFLNTLYSGIASGYVSCWRKSDKSSVFFPITELDQAVQFLQSEPNVYFRVTLLDGLPPEGERGDSDCTGSVVAFVADFDVFNPLNPTAHSRQRSSLPQDVNEVIAFLSNDLPLAPSVLVHSGNGIHAYWLLTRPIDSTISAQRKHVGKLMADWQTYVIRCAEQKHGWKVDNVGDLARVLRAPGTINEKKGIETTVRLISQSDARYSLEQFQAALPTNDTPPDPAPVSKRVRRANDNDQPLDHEQILKECAWFKDCFENQATLDEPNWYAALSIVAHCANPDSLAQEFSKGHPGYDPAETSKKLEQARDTAGPRTCQNIEEKLGCTHCATCPFRGKVKSPAVLGRLETELLRVYGYLLPTQQFINFETGRRLSKEQFNDKHRADLKKDNPAKVMLFRPMLMKYDEIIYCPGQQTFTDTTFNTWRRGGPLPVEGDISPFVEHLELIFQDELARKHFIKWLAHTLQHPDRKIKHLILLIGGAGVGKSFFSSFLIPRLFGAHNVSLIGPEDIKGQWTDWLAEKQFVVIEELMAFGQLETYNKLKPLITQETVRVSQKYVAHYDVANTANFICTSNHDNPIKLDPDDRRFFVYKTPATARDRSYYDQLFKWTEENLSAIAHWLNTYDLTGFNPDAPPPMTPAKAALIEVSREPLEQMIREMIEMKEPPFGDRDLVLPSGILSAIGLKDFGKYSETDIRRVLHRVGYSRLEREKKTTGLKGRQSFRPWCRANHHRWEAASGKECWDELSRSTA